MQETLVIPLYGKKMCSELFPQFYRDETAIRLIDSIDFFVNDTYISTVKRERLDLEDSDGKFFTPLTKRNLFEFNYQFPFAGDYRVFAQAVNGQAIDSRPARAANGLFCVIAHCQG